MTFSNFTDQASLFGESSTSNRSRLCKTLPDFLHDNSALPYLIQFMDSFNAVQVLQCWLATESFNKASWSHSLTTTMEIEGKTNIPNDGVVGREEGRDITQTQKGNSETKTVPKIQLNGSSLNDKESVLNNNQSRQRINPMDSPDKPNKGKTHSRARSDSAAVEIAKLAERNSNMNGRGKGHRRNISDWKNVDPKTGELRLVTIS